MQSMWEVCFVCVCVCVGGGGGGGGVSGVWGRWDGGVGGGRGRGGGEVMRTVGEWGAVGKNG